MASDALAKILVFTLALAAYSWTLSLRFQLDDYWILPAARSELGEVGRLLLNPARLFDDSVLEHPASESPLFQPVLWALLAAEAAATGVPLDPRLFHLTSAVLHGLCALLLYLLLRRSISSQSSQAALIGAAFFALHPAGAQAVSWIAARGLVLVTLFGIVALLVIESAIQRQSARRTLLAGLALAAAFGSHAAAITLVPILLAALILGARRRKGRWLGHAFALLVPAVIAYALRSRYLGSGAFGYIGGTSVGAAALPRMLEAGPRLLLHLLSPWNEAPEVSHLRPLIARLGLGRAALALPWVLLAALALLRLDRRAIRRAAESALALVILSAPALFLWSMWPDVQDNRLSRALYPGTAALGAFLAALLARRSDTVPNGERVFARFARVLSVTILFLAGLDAHVHVACVEREARDRIESREAALRDAAREVGRAGAVVALDRFETHAGVPLIGARHFKALLAPPFDVEPHSAAGHIDLPSALASGALGRLPGPVRVLEWNGAAMVQRGDLLPPLPDVPPTFVAGSVLENGSPTWKPARPCSPRAVKSLRFSREAGVEGGTTAFLLRSNRAQLVLRASPHAGDDAVVLGLDLFEDWMLSAQLLEVAAFGPGLKRSQPLVLREVPALPHPGAPAAGARLPIGRTPEFLLSGILPGNIARLRFQIRAGEARFLLLYQVPYAALEPAGQHDRWRPTLDQRIASTLPELSWETLPSLFEQRLRPYGVDHVEVQWRVELLYPEAEVERARSPWSHFVLTDRLR